MLPAWQFSVFFAKAQVFLSGLFCKPAFFSRGGKVFLKRLKRRARRRYRTARVTLLRHHAIGVVLMLLAFVGGSYFTLSEYLLPRIFALSESTHTFSSDTAFSASGYDDNSGAVSVQSNSVTLSKATNWWDLSYKYNKQLTIKNLSGDDLAANATIQYKVNTKELYDAGQLQADCDDLRIVYYTGSGSHAEVVRSHHVPGGFTNCSDSTNTTVAFPLQAGLTNGSSTTHYYLYYGNADATNPGYGDNGYSIGNAEATLVCPFDGTTTCVDGETPSTATGAIRYSTKGALSFDGNNDRVEVSRSAIGSTMTTELTFETWFKTSDKTKSGSIFGGNNFGYDFHSMSYTYGHAGSQYFNFTVRTGAGTTGVNVSTNTGGTINNNQWYHIAGTYDGTIVKIYLNGALGGQAALSGNSSTSGPSLLGIGATYCGTVNYPNCTNYLPGYLDEVRISNSVRYTSNFTPQTTPFEPDANTKLLLHFDENGDDPRNTGKAIDSSGNGNHGTITGAKYVGGLVGVDSSSSDSGNVGPSSYGSHNGIFIEEGTTNKITNPSFENATAYNTNWGSNYFNYDSSADTFTASMAKRNSAGPFAAGVIVQGLPSGLPADILSVQSGTQVAGSFYSNGDSNQGSVVLWWTPEFSDRVGQILGTGWSDFNIWQNSDGSIKFTCDGATMVQTTSFGVNPGQTYSIVVRWDNDSGINGTNHVSLSIDDTHYFGRTSDMGCDMYRNGLGIGVESNGYFTGNGIIEGLTIYRRPLFDGTYGIDVGNGDEINQVYNSGTGKDPTLVTGSWDVVFALPTNASTGALTTGTGNAWSHPHASNLLYTSTTNTGGFMMNGTYTTDGFATVGSPSSVGALATSEKIFSGGYKFTSTGASQGIYRTFTATSGGDYVIRAIGHSDGTCDPQVKITRADGTTEISHLDGTTTSTRTDPDVYLFTWEAPAAEANQIQLLNTASSGTCYWHQVEVLSNLQNNPSLEGTYSSDPPRPTGLCSGDDCSPSYNAMDSGDSEEELTEVHSGTKSLQLNSTATSSDFFMGSNSTTTVGKFIASGAVAKGSVSIRTNFNRGLFQSSTSSFVITSPVSSTWNAFQSVYRTNSTWKAMGIQGTSSGPVYIDDLYSFQLTDVSLTVTPASEANSSESSGLRVDGADTLTQTISGLSTDRGVIKFKFTPRHSAANAIKFWEGSGASPRVFYASDGTSNNYIDLRWDSADTLSMYYAMNGSTGSASYNATSAGDFVAGTTYNLEIRYTGSGNMVLAVNGTDRITASSIPAAFSATLTTAYWGSYSNGLRQVDATISSFTALTPTENTTAPYYKFGSKSAKLVNSGSLPDEYTTAIDPDSTATHTLSAYVYDGTSGNVGGIISSSIAKLVFGGTVVAPSSYTDMGGGWWRLVYSAATTDASRLYGVQALAGKTIYVDGVQLEAKSYATTYADGSLGSGYSWSGTVNDSTSSRTGGGIGKVDYSTTNNISAASGSVSFWLNRKFFIPDDNGWGFKSGYFTTCSGGQCNDGEFSVLTSGSTGSNLNCVWGATGVPTSLNSWYHVVVTWDNSITTRTCYVDSVQKYNSASVTTVVNRVGVGLGTNWSDRYKSDAVISDLRIYNSALTAEQVTDLYYTGLQTHQSGSETDDRYQASGTYTSPVIDLSANGAWGTTPWAATETLNSGTIAYSTRTSADNSTWSNWESVSGSTIASTALRYLQWKADLAPASSPVGGAPTITAAQIAYVEDSTAPVNPDTTASGFSTSSVPSADLTSATWYNYPTPKFTWAAGTDPAANGQSASGVASYHVLLTTDNTAVPASNTGDSCYALISAGSESYTVGTSNANCSLSNGVYYLRLQTKDSSGNVADAVTLFTYKYDSSAPNAPASVSATTIGYSATNDFTFFWPTASDNGSSGIAGYEYKTGANGAEWVFTTATQVSNVAAYQEGQNVFYVRSKDVAGNYSTVTSSTGTVSFYYNSTAPTAPANLAITPSSSADSPAAANAFTVTWDEPATFSGSIAKYHYCVNCTPSASTMTETTSAQTVARTLSNMALATQQGRNTLYLVAEDNNVNSETGHGNRNFDAYSSIDFYASTVAPDKPINVTISDASDRDNSKWRLTLAWDPGDADDLPDHYQVYRSSDNTTFAKIGNVNGTAYTDGSLTQSTLYYYKVLAVDNAGASSLYSATVSKAPEGKYASPPSAGGTPSAVVGSSTAVVKWTTGRKAFGAVEFGKTTAYGASSAESTSTTDHSVKLTGLSPGTTYHYRVQSLDDSDLVGYERDQAYSSDYTFTTLSTADISQVSITDQTLESAVISWKTTSLATSKIEYGTTTEYGSVVEVSTTADESVHSARITGLKHSTTYHFRVSGTTADGDDIFSQDNVFSTLTFPKITAVVFSTDQSQGGTTATLAWSTNVLTTATAEYQAAEIDIAVASQNQRLLDLGLIVDTAGSGKQIDLGILQNLSRADLALVPITANGEKLSIYDGALSDRHIQRASGLTDGALYIFTLRGIDRYGNEVVSEPIRYVTGIDTKPPTITELILETPMSGASAESKARIIASFTTDEPARAKIEWGVGVGTEYSQATEFSEGFGTTHALVLRDLNPTTSYHLRLVVQDETGNQTVSDDIVVVTPTAQAAALDIILKNLQDVFGFLKL